jgi:hypothetical protein
MRALVIAATIVGLASCVAAQRGGVAGHPGVASGHAGAAPTRSPGANFLVGGAHRAGLRRASRFGTAYRTGYPGYASLPFPFFGDNFDPDDIYSTGYPVASEPPPYLMEALQNLANPAASSMSSLMASTGNREGLPREGSSHDPEMIEFQNGRYVQVKGREINSDAEPINFAENSASANSRAAKAPQADSAPQTIAAAPLAQVTLIFRDGHREEVRDYTIAQGTLYARGDYYTDGYWNKNIDLANLNVQETQQANAANNIRFVLPSSPNEVITRP